MAVWSDNVTSKMIIEADRIDSEYFKPIYLSIQEKLSSSESMWKYVEVLIHPAEFLREYSNDGWTVIRTQNVRPMSIEIDGNEIYLDSEKASKITKNAVRNGDILITRTGANFGQTSLYTGERENALVTSHSLIIRTNNSIHPAFLSLYLNTYYGRMLIDQCMYGSSQPEIAPKFLKKIPIPRFPEATENSIINDVLKSYELRKNSKSLYTQAKGIFEKELGLDQLELEKPKSYEASFSEVVRSLIISPYYFQPKYRQILKLICSRAIKLNDVVEKYSSGYAFKKSHLSKKESSAKLIKITNILKGEINIQNSVSLNQEGCYAGRGEITEYGDLLVGMSGTIGITGLVGADSTGAFINQRIFRIKPKEDISSEYLALVLNSIIGKYQFERVATGGVQSNISSKDILRILIPRIGKEEEIITKLIKKSNEANQESAKLLEQAKKRVEDLIEGVIKE